MCDVMELQAPFHTLEAQSGLLGSPVRASVHSARLGSLRSMHVYECQQGLSYFQERENRWSEGGRRNTFILSATVGEGPSVAWPALKLTLTQAASAIWCISNQRGVCRLATHTHAHILYIRALCMQAPFSIPAPLWSQKWPEEVREKRRCSRIESFEEQSCEAQWPHWLSSKLRRESLHCCLIMHQCCRSQGGVEGLCQGWCGNEGPTGPSEVAHVP